jgi:radical SAM protein with 4Fe4S-binding SPASM domain
VFEHFLTFSEKWLVEMYIPWAEYHPAAKRLEEKIRVEYVGCRAGRDRLTVNPCGDISVCVCFDFPEFYLGNVRLDSLNDIFLNSSLCDIMRHPEKHGICTHCSNVMHCGGGCRVSAYILSGKCDGQDSTCPEFKHTGVNPGKSKDET